MEVIYGASENVTICPTIVLWEWEGGEKPEVQTSIKSYLVFKVSIQE